jgi:hypothetical protein
MEVRNGVRDMRELHEAEAVARTQVPCSAPLRSALASAPFSLQLQVQGQLAAQWSALEAEVPSPGPQLAVALSLGSPRQLCHRQWARARCCS